MEIANTFFLKNLDFLLKKCRRERNKKKQDILGELKMSVSTISRWNSRGTLSNPSFERVVEYFASEFAVALTQDHMLNWDLTERFDELEGLDADEEWFLNEIRQMNEEQRSALKKFMSVFVPPKKENQTT